MIRYTRICTKSLHLLNRNNSVKIGLVICFCCGPYLFFFKVVSLTSIVSIQEVVCCEEKLLESYFTILIFFYCFRIFNFFLSFLESFLKISP